jgi:hypothetical protein
VTAALFPAIVVDMHRRQDIRIRLGTRKASDLHSRMLSQNAQRGIRGTIVKEDIAVDERIVVSEEVREHVLVVPADGIEMNDRWSRAAKKHLDLS